MAITINRSRGAHTRTAAVDSVGPRVYERPTGAALTGLAALLVGAWGAVAGYIGPYFGFDPVATHVWVGNWQNGLLHLAPGAVAAAAGLMLLVMGPARRSVRGGALLLPALLLLAAGAWFVIGPVAWPTFHSGPAFHPVLSASRNLLNVACSSYAPGLVLVMLGGMALKAGSVPAVAVDDPYTPAEAVAPGERPVGAGEGGLTERERLARREGGLAERERLAEREGGLTERERLAERERMAERDRLAGREGVGPVAQAESGRPVAGAEPTVAEAPVGEAGTSTVDPAARGEV